MKKRITLLAILSLTTLFTLTSCGIFSGNNSGSNTTISSTTTSSSTTNPNTTTTTTTNTSSSSSSSSTINPTTTTTTVVPTTSSNVNPTTSTTNTVVPTTTTTSRPTTPTTTITTSSSTSQQTQTGAVALTYTVEFTTYTDTTISTQTILAGNKVSKPSLTRDNTQEYTYTLDGWYTDSSFNHVYDFNSPVNSDLHLYAKWISNKNEYRISFLNDDDSEISADDVAYGEQIVPPTAPTKTSTAQYEYIFDGWYTAKTGGIKVSTFPTVTEAVTYYAKYNETLRTYTVTWKNFDGNTLETDEDVAYGTTPSYNGQTPTKPETSTYRYTFKGWDKEISAVTGDITYTATFNEIDKATPVVYYTITWKNYNGDELLVDDHVEENTLPVYPNQDPEKPETAQYTYTFNGWTPTLVNATADATYTATFTENTRQYTFTFYDEDGITTLVTPSTVDYGTQIIAPTNPTKASTVDTVYTFDGWYTAKTGGEKVTSFGTITGNVSYYARYTESVRKYTITWLNDDNSTIDTTEVAYGATPTHSAPSKSSTSQYTYTFAGWTPTVTSVTGAATYKATFTEAVRKYTITWKNDDDTVINTTEVEYGSIPTHAEPTKASTAQYTYTFAGWNPTVTEVTGEAIYKATFTENAISSDTISANTAYSFTGSATKTGDIVITEGYENSSAVTNNKLTIDTTNGKFKSNGGGWYQINANTKLSFKTSQAVSITITMYGNGNTSGLYSISGTGLSKNNSMVNETFKTTGAGTVTITELINDYISRIEIELIDESVQAESIDLSFTKTFKSTNTSAGNGTYKTVNAKTIYKVGEALDTTGIYGIVTYNDSTNELISNNGLTFTGFDSTTTGKKTITVSYEAGGNTVSKTYDIYVVNAAPSVVSDVLQVKVNPSYTGTLGEIVSGYNTFNTISQALDYLRSLDSSYTNKTKLLYVNAGTYNEKLWIDIPNLIIRGANKTNTIIEYNSLYYNSNYANVSNYKSVSIDQDGFEHVTDSTQTMTIAEEAINCTLYDITVSNYWNSYNRFVDAFGTNSIEHRALALLIYADKFVMQECRLLGYQDTLEAMSGRSYIYNSYISGATDFIFGTNPTMYFKNCEIHSIYNGSTDGGYINAFKGINKNSSDYKNYGVIYDGCSFTKDTQITSSNTSIARPWDYYSNIMVMNSTFDSHISKAAYTTGTTKNQRYVCWTNSGQVAAEPTSENVHFYEYNNSGSGALTSAINGMSILNSSEASNYNNLNTIFGTLNGYDDIWSPSIIEDSEPEQNTLNITSASGYAEGAYVEFSASTSNILAYYKKSTDTSYSLSIASELIRMNGENGRVDVVGLKAGTYNIKLVDSTDSTLFVETENLIVEADDRSGYAHFGRTEGIGAYNNDGTLKSNVVVVYVTEENKNTVTANGYTGIANILKNKSKSSNPLDIRIIGTVGAAMWASPTYPTSAYSEATTSTIRGNNGNYLQLQNYDESDLLDTFNVLDDSTYTKLNGLTNKIKYDSSKKEFDSYYNMLDVSNATDVTIEGIGLGASLAQWGITWKNCLSIEVKNLTFTDYPEDACAFEGNTSDLSTSTTSMDVDAFSYGYYWIHNNTFNIGKNNWDVCSEHDKGDGDGSTDIKKVRNATYSYNKYVGTHKTGLVGGSEKHITANLTFHHNWYVGCKSRMPYARQANMHMYNNYYQSSTGTTMQIYAGAYAFVENCYFKNDNKTFEFNNKGYTTPAVKSYNNIFDGSKTYDISGVTITTDRTELVSNGNIFNQNFDTDSSFFYYDSTNQKSNVTRMDNAADLPTIIPTLSGAGLKGGSYIDSANSSSDPGCVDETKYTLTYDANGHGTAPSTKEVSTISDSDLPVLSATGYTFGGWYNESSCTTVVSSGTKLSSDKIIYAKWTETSSLTTYSMNFNDNNLVDENGFFTITGDGASTSTNTGSKTYQDVTYTRTLKFDSKPTLSFTTTSIGNLTLVCGTDTTTIKVDGVAYTPDSDFIVNITNLSTGSHTITKGSGQNYLYLIVVQY